MLDHLIELCKERKIFLRKRKNWKIKALSVLLYHMGLSYRKTSAVLNDMESFSYEAVRQWYTRCHDLFSVERGNRKAVAVDETKVKIEHKQIYIWNAIDVDKKVILAMHISITRTSFDAIHVLRKVLNTCTNKPIILVDRGPWYRWALQRLGLQFQHQTFGERNAIEGWYSLYKARVKRFWKRFPYRSSLESVMNWSMAWIAIYNLEVR